MKKGKRPGRGIRYVILTVLVFGIGFVLIKKTDGIYRRISEIKSFFRENREYARRHGHIADISGLEPLMDEERAWYQSCHFISHSGGGIDGRTYTNSRQAWEQSYADGNRVFDADLSFTSDGILVLRHEWRDNLETGGVAARQSDAVSDLNGSDKLIAEQEIPDFAAFSQTKIFYKYDPMSCEEMLKFMELHRDLYVSCDVKEDSYEQAYSRMVDLAETLGLTDVLGRIIVNFYQFEDYETINSVYPFQNYVLRQHFKRAHNYYELIAFCVEKEIHVVSISACYAEDEGVQLMQKYGIHPLVAVCNYISDMQDYYELGIYHAVSDWLHEEDWSYCIPAGADETEHKRKPVMAESEPEVPDAFSAIRAGTANERKRE